MPVFIFYEKIKTGIKAKEILILFHEQHEIESMEYHVLVWGGRRSHFYVERVQDVNAHEC